MAWTAPRTWVTGEVVSAAQMNAHVRDNLTELRSSKTCRVKRTTAQGISDAASPWADSIAFTAEDEDLPGWHSTVTNPERIIPDVAGVYQVTAGVEFEAAATGQRSVRIGVNGIDTVNTKSQVTQSAAGSIPTILTCSAQVRVNGTTDYISVGAWQNTGGSLGTGTTIGCWCAVTWIGE